MKTLNLTPEQAKTLEETLISYLSDLRMEIVDTNNSKFKESLHVRRDLLNEILTKLSEE